MSDDPFEYVTPPLKVVRDMVCIPRARHEALMAAAKALRQVYRDCTTTGTREMKRETAIPVNRAIAALRAAGILEGK